MVEDVIARRVLKIDGQNAECRFYRPEKQKGGSFLCQAQIDYPEGTKTKRAGGVDEVQALLLCMMFAHTDLLAVRNVDGRSVEWFDDQSLGLPVAREIRHWDPDNRM